MKKILYAIKLNKTLSKFLTFTNTKNLPATAAQKDLDFAVFFDSSAVADKMVDAYLTHPQCKMSIANKKFISLEPYDFEYEIKDFPFTSKFKLVDTTDLKNVDNCMFCKVQIQYGDFVGFGYVCLKAYKTLVEESKK